MAWSATANSSATVSPLSGKQARPTTRPCIAHQKLVIAKLQRQLYGPKTERSARLIDQFELTFEELAGSVTEDEIAAEQAAAKKTVKGFTQASGGPGGLPRESSPGTGVHRSAA